MAKKKGSNTMKYDDLMKRVNARVSQVKANKRSQQVEKKNAVIKASNDKAIEYAKQADKYQGRADKLGKYVGIANEIAKSVVKPFVRAGLSVVKAKTDTNPATQLLKKYKGEGMVKDKITVPWLGEVESFQGSAKDIVAKVKKGEKKQAGGKALEDALDVASLVPGVGVIPYIAKTLRGGKKAKQAVEAVKVAEKAAEASKGKKIVDTVVKNSKELAKTGAVGAGYTGGYAAAEGMKQDKSMEEILKDIYSQAPYGAVFAAGLHGTAKVASAAASKLRAGKSEAGKAPEISVKPADTKVQSDLAGDIKKERAQAQGDRERALALGLIQRQAKLSQELKNSPSPDHFERVTTEMESNDAILKDLRKKKFSNEDISYLSEDLFKKGIDVNKIESSILARRVAPDSPDLRVQADRGEVQADRPFGGSTAEPKAGTVDTVVTDRRSLVKKYASEMGMADRVADKPGGKRLGSYSPYQKLVRLKGDANFETFAHEIGHDLDASGVVNRKAFEKELKPMDYDQSKMRSSEGFAEFMRLYVTDRETAQKVAPEFFAHFEASVPDEVKVVLNRAAEEYGKFTSMTRGAQMRSMIAGRPTSTLDRVKEGIGERGILGSVREAFDTFYTNLVDKFHPILRKMGEDVYNQFRLSAGKQALVDSTLKEQTFDFKTLKPNGEGFEPILGDLDKLASAKGKNGEEMMSLFGQYLINRRAANDIENKMVFGFRRESHADELAKLEAEFPEFKGLADRIYSFEGRVLDYVHDAGVISDELYSKLKANQNYVPFFLDKEKTKVEYPTKRGQQSGAPVKRYGDEDIKGTVINPVESIYKNTYILMTAANNNQAMLSVLNRLRELPRELSPYLREVPKSVKPISLKADEVKQMMKQFGIDVREEGEAASQAVTMALKLMEKNGDLPTIFRGGKMPKTTLYAFDNGRARAIEVADPQLLDAISGLNTRTIEAMKNIVNIVSLPASTLRAGATLTPSFMTRNVIRDAVGSAIYSRHGFSLPFGNILRSLGALTKKAFTGDDEVFKLYRASGGELAQLVSLDRAAITEQMYLFGKSGQSPARGYMSEWAKEPLKPLRDASSGLEKATRFGEFQKRLNDYMVQVKEGKLSEKQAIELAGLDSREITLDFARTGKLFESFGVNRISAFFNASIQGKDKLIRELAKGNPATYAKIFSYVTLPSIALWVANKDNPDYQNLPEWRKNAFWNVPTGDPDMPFLTIPKPFELGIIFGTIPEKLLDLMVKEDPKAGENIMEAMSEVVKAPSALPTAIVPFLENYSNRSYYFDSAIVPESKKDLPVELQSRSTSPEYLKDLAEKFPGMFSPAKAEQFIYGYTGGLGRYASQGADAVYRDATDKPAAPSRYPSSIDLGMKILKELGLSTEAPIGTKDASTQQFYDDYTKSQGDMAALREKVKSGEDPSRYIESGLKSKPLGAVAAMLTSIRKQKDLVRNDPKLSGDEKRKKMDDLDRAQSELLNKLGY